MEKPSFNDLNFVVELSSSVTEFELDLRKQLKELQQVLQLSNVSKGSF